MHLALTLDPMQDADLLFAQQLGVDHILAETASLGRSSLAVMANRVRQAGLELAALDSLPTAMYSNAIVGEAAQARAEADIAQVCAIIREAGQAGIRQIGYCWGISARGTASTEGRGGAARAIYDWDQPGADDASDPRREQLWANLASFLRQVLPDAEKCGVRLACQLAHPATGTAHPRILDRLEDVERLFRLAPSVNHGLDLDHGFFAALLGKDPCDIIRRLSKEGRIFSVRVRHLERCGEAYCQGFLDQDRESLLRMLQCYRDTSFQGTLRPAPTPVMAEDTSWGHKGYAFSIGYLKALLQAYG